MRYLKCRTAARQFCIFVYFRAWLRDVAKRMRCVCQAVVPTSVPMHAPMRCRGLTRAVRIHHAASPSAPQLPRKACKLSNPTSYNHPRVFLPLAHASPKKFSENAASPFVMRIPRACATGEGGTRHVGCWRLEVGFYVSALRARFVFPCTPARIDAPRVFSASPSHSTLPSKPSHGSKSSASPSAPQFPRSAHELSSRTSYVVHRTWLRLCVFLSLDHRFMFHSRFSETCVNLTGGGDAW